MTARGRVVLIGPAVLALGALLVAPLGIMAFVSTLQRGEYGGVLWAKHTAEAYVQFIYERDLFDRLVVNPDYIRIFLRSVGFAAATAACTLILALPTALWMAFQPPRRRLLLLLIVTVPLWTNLLVRNYAWMLLLGDGGLIDRLLLALGLTRAPMEILYTPAATLIGLVYSFLPYMLLPIYVSMEKIDRRLIEGAYDLGASRARAIRRIVLPLSLPGIAGGMILVFVPCLGAFISPELLGGGKSMMIGSLIQQQFGQARNWPFGAALAFTLLALILLARCGRTACGFAAARRQRGDGRGAAVPVSAGAGGGLAVIGFLYGPILVLIALSFNAGDSALGAWSGFSLRWYRAVAGDHDMLHATGISLAVACIATLAGTGIALLAALGTAGARFRRQGAFEALIGLPLIAPDIVAEIAMLLLFVAVGLPLGIMTLILAHLVFAIPVGYLPIRARLQGMDASLAEAAADLGAPPVTCFRRILLPLLWPGIVSGAMLAFVGSLGDVVVSYFVSGPGATTLPVYVFSMVRMGVTPAVNAISSLLVMLSAVLLGSAYMFARRLR